MNYESPLALAYRTPLEDSLIGISAALSTELSVESVLDHILEQARLFTRAEAGTIYLVESDHRLHNQVRVIQYLFEYFLVALDLPAIAFE